MERALELMLSNRPPPVGPAVGGCGRLAVDTEGSTLKEAAMAEEGDNLATVLGAWLDATRAGTLDALEAMMDEHITWYGIAPGTVCHGRAATIETMRRGMGRLPRVTRMEAIEVGDVVVMSLTGPDFRYPDGEERPASERERPHLFMRLRLRDGRVTEMRATDSHEAALEQV